MSCLRALGTSILVLAACCGSVAAQTGTVNFTFSSAYNCDLLGTDGEINAALSWSKSHQGSDYTIFNVFGGHFGMDNAINWDCYYVNAPGVSPPTAVPYGGLITTPYAAYQLGPPALTTSATTTSNFVPSPNVIIFGKSLGLTYSSSVSVTLPPAQQMCYSSVNFLLVYWHWRGNPSGNETAVNQSMTLSASYQDGTTQVLYTGTIPGWEKLPDGTFRAALTCSECVGWYNYHPYYSTIWTYPGTDQGPWRIFEFSPSATAFQQPDATRVLMGFQFAAVETGSGAESLAVILAGAGCPAPDPPSDPGAPQFTLSLSPSWVYQNTPATLARGGHISNLNVTITNSNGNSSFTASVQAVTGSGGEVTALSTSNAFAWVIQGSSRTDGVSGTGSLSIMVTVSGNAGGPATQQVTMMVRKLGDLAGSGTVDGSDLFLMNQRLDGFPVSYADAAFDLTCNGAITADDRILLNRVLNGLPVP